jgi:nickel-dependent lactate racemase
LEGNPLHEEQLQIVAKVGEIYALNTVIDEARDLNCVTFGDIEASHLAAIDFVSSSAIVRTGRRFKTILTSAAGYPLDKTFYQTVKGMVTCTDILEPGGTIIICSECSEGFGSPEYRIAQQRLVELGVEKFTKQVLDKTLADIDEWQTEKQLIPLRIGKVQLYTSGLRAGDRAITGVELIDSVEAAVANSLIAYGDTALAVIPEGPYVVPIVG